MLEPLVQVDQAIFTSIRSGRVQGYQLAARSDGIDDRLAQSLIRWGPSHAALCSGDRFAESVNFHAISEDRFALSRTMYGGAEYSDRGGLQLVTVIALVDASHLIDYEFDAVALMRQSRLDGRFRLPVEMTMRLPSLSLPDVSPAVFWKPATRSGDEKLAEDLATRLANGEKLAITHCQNPLPLLQRIIARTPRDQRLNLSFCTGLKPTAHRPFRLHFLPGDSAELRRSAAALGLTCLSATG